MVSSLSGRAVLITGAAGGFGRAITRAFLASGASVAAIDIAADRLKNLSVELGEAGYGDRFFTSNLDIADFEACGHAVSSVREAFGSIDVLINNGAIGMGAVRADHMSNLVKIEEIGPGIWDDMIRVNLSGAWYLTKHAHPYMKANRWGRIINVTTSFFTMMRGSFHPYGPAKAGLEAMSAGHAAEFKDQGITVNVVVPGGPSDTPMVPPEAPYIRSDLISPSKMAPPMLWLCSDAAEGVTGNRYVAAHWDEEREIGDARGAAEAPIGWPDLANRPVWPGGRPGS
ncbi:MAG: SDR family NAD(P)-dependent oxidoreductase [Hyphomicrobiaceae bacterium]